MTGAVAASSVDRRPAPVRRVAGSVLRRHLAGPALVLAAIVLGLAVGASVALDLWYLALVGLLALPGFVIVHRAPLVAVGVWIVLVPTVFQLEGAPRYVFWLAHRFLPVAALALLVLGRALGLSTRRFPRLGVAEFLMAGYLVVTVLSVLYTSDRQATELIDTYDRIVVPMALYALVRLLMPGERALRAVVPALVYVLVTQTVVGAASWLAPGLLPTEWLTRAGTRTTGTLASPSLFGVTLVLAGLVILHVGAGSARRWVRDASTILFLVGMAMLMLTFSRGVWLAAVIAIAAAAAVHGRLLVRSVPVVALAVGVLALSGLLGGVIDRLDNRADNEQTAVARLPLAFASVAMFQEKPFTGWGVGNFDRYDRDFQRSLDDYVPVKDHASHNRYLRLLAEQGVVGAGLFVAPLAYWLVRLRRVRRLLPRSGLLGPGLSVFLLAVLASHVVVNTFSDTDTTYSNAQWWIVIALIAVQVQAATEPALVAESERGGR